VENRLLKKTENSKIKTAKRIQNVKEAAKGQDENKMSGLLSNIWEYASPGLVRWSKIF
jgi:cytoskeletal protein RodZ